MPVAKGSSGMGSSKRITEKEDTEIMDKSVHTQHKDYQKFLQTFTPQQQHQKTMKKKVLVPVEQNIKVPVYRKEADRKMKTVKVAGTKLVPVTRYKQVEETVLDVEYEMVGGHKEKRAVPVTRIRQIPYQDYVEKQVEIEVQVPDDEVVQRVGSRVDKHVVSKVVEVEEDLVYEMRPVLVKKGEKRMKELGDHHAFKTEHGAPNWDPNSTDTWRNRPTTPEFRKDLHRPGSAVSIVSAASSMVVPRLKDQKVFSQGEIKSPSYFPRKKSYSVPKL